MEFLVKITAPEELRQSDIINDLKTGLHKIVDGGEPDCSCSYLKLLSDVKITSTKKIRRKES